MRSSRDTALLLFPLLLLHILVSEAALGPSQQPKSYQQLDEMITRCFQTACKDWMHECHWFCDSIKGRSFYRRCLECLSWRGRHCHECFDL